MQYKIIRFKKSFLVALLVIIAFLGFGYFWETNKTYALIVPIPCSDSDSGKDYYLTGTVTRGDVVRTDECKNEKTLSEYYCNKYNRIFKNNVRCAYGCLNGSCKPGITVQSPSNKVKINVNQGQDKTYRIRWISREISAVDICLLKGANSEISEEIARDISTINKRYNFYNWHIASNQTTATEDYKIRIKEATGTCHDAVSVYDDSNKFFTIRMRFPTPTPIPSLEPSPVPSPIPTPEVSPIPEETPIPSPSPPTVVSCTDSDGGENYFQKGTTQVTLSNGTVIPGNDVCWSGTQLRERYCDGLDAKFRDGVDCGFCGCLDGACKRSGNTSISAAYSVGHSEGNEWVYCGNSIVSYSAMTSITPYQCGGYGCSWLNCSRVLAPSGYQLDFQNCETVYAIDSNNWATCPAGKIATGLQIVQCGFADCARITCCGARDRALNIKNCVDTEMSPGNGAVACPYNKVAVAVNAVQCGVYGCAQMQCCDVETCN